MARTKPFRYIGVTDECDYCEQCGKPNLKKTVVLAVLDAEGTDDELVRYGTSCAAKALGYGPGYGAQIRQQAEGAHRRTLEAARDARKMLAHYCVPETGDDYDINHVAAIYRDTHAHAKWAPTVTWEGWKDRARDMIQRKRAALADAHHITHQTVEPRGHTPTDSNNR